MLKSASIFIPHNITSKRRPVVLSEEIHWFVRIPHCANTSKNAAYCKTAFIHNVVIFMIICDSDVSQIQYSWKIYSATYMYMCKYHAWSQIYPIMKNFRTDILGKLAWN